MAFPAFQLRIPIETLRRMNRGEYYDAHRWLRIVRREVKLALDRSPDADPALLHFAIYGTAPLIGTGEASAPPVTL